MAKWVEYTEEQQNMWEEWLAERPQVIKDMVVKYDLHPEKVYCFESNKEKRFVLHSLDEDGTVTVQFRRELSPNFILPLMDYNVFGVNPESLLDAEQDFDLIDGSVFLQDKET